jgi:hypothetical protein
MTCAFLKLFKGAEFRVALWDAESFKMKHLQKHITVFQTSKKTDELLVLGLVFSF